MAGRKRQVSDTEILRQFALSAEPVLVASELAEEFDMSRQGIFDRLQQLEEEGYVESAMKASARVWWITSAGKRHLVDSSD
ncbi:winged helix-turn-helix domain-containing protein [Halobaculum gomorrense]|uniref:Winged helix-turn-helix DNA-binding n=1 Tax=Halobaculum gomorrense TaxID=43928 RepID=A0A1M5URX9_9EURY|nr:winged helix-turn-helix domain-containing protein [Halobaculum gomorrense]SHH65827.1 Winged helix-turn-helix DNA-binding [Halobaculum gomorrense]